MVTHLTRASNSNILKVKLLDTIIGDNHPCPGTLAFTLTAPASLSAQRYDMSGLSGGLPKN